MNHFIACLVAITLLLSITPTLEAVEPKIAWDVSTAHFETLFKKAGSRTSSDWTFEQLRKRLSKWEYNFLLAHMHYYVSDNMGHIEGLSSFLDDRDGDKDIPTREELLVAWKDIGYERMYAGILAAERALKKLKIDKYDDLTPGQYAVVLSAIEEAQKAHKIEEHISIPFYHYITKNTDADKKKQAANTPALPASDAKYTHPFVLRIESIQIPPVDIADASPSEMLEFLRIKMKDWDPEPDPAKKGFSIIMMAAPMDKTKQVSYKRPACSAGTLFQDLAKLLDVDIHVTEVGVVITQVDKPPFPNPKSPTGAILKTYHARSNPDKALSPKLRQ